VKSGEILAMMALTAVNLAYYQELMDGVRAAIERGRLADFMTEVKEGWKRGEAERQ
jgi:queuine tRNA-ribosyltransferase